MKKFNIKYILLLAGLFVTAFAFNACDDNKNDDSGTPMTINRVFLQDANATVSDRLVEFARLGQVIRLEGSGFVGVMKVFVNGRSNYFNPVYVTDNSMMFQISGETPTIDAPDGVRNTIRLEKSADNYVVFDFEIRAGLPSITNVSHTMPQAGDVIMISGKGLQGVTSVTFPGNVVVSSGIVSDDEDGEWCMVTVPAGVSDDGGSLLVIGANGGAYSQACFNYKKGLLHNFDDVQNYSWGSGVNNEALTDVIPANKPQSQGGYQLFNSAGSLAGGADQRFWLNSNPVMTTMSVIPGATAAGDCGIQMDIYVEGEWNSGIIRFVMADGWGSSRYCMIYQPVYVNGGYDKDAFVNPGSWFTITLPFGISSDFEGKTLDDVINQMSIASYKQAGPWFENTGITDIFDPVPATQKVYFDNIRVVPLTAPVYSDFPDEE